MLIGNHTIQKLRLNKLDGYFINLLRIMFLIKIKLKKL